MPSRFDGVTPSGVLGWYLSFFFGGEGIGDGASRVWRRAAGARGLGWLMLLLQKRRILTCPEPETASVWSNIAWIDSVFQLSTCAGVRPRSRAGVIFSTIGWWFGSMMDDTLRV